MGAIEFGQLVAERIRELQRLEPQAKWSQNKVARRFGELPDGRGLDSTQVRMIKQGRRILDHDLVERLIQVLGLDQDSATELKAWKAAGLWPDSFNAEDVDLSEPVTTRREAASRVESPDEGASAANPELNGTVIMGDRAGIAA
jgi:transcriptional regulator with XRE-family HTH domain